MILILDIWKKKQYANDLGSIMYNMVCIRSDVAHVISILTRFMANPRPEHY